MAGVEITEVGPPASEASVWLLGVETTEVGLPSGKKVERPGRRFLRPAGPEVEGLVLLSEHASQPGSPLRVCKPAPFPTTTNVLFVTLPQLAEPTERLVAHSQDELLESRTGVEVGRMIFETAAAIELQRSFVGLENFDEQWIVQ